jgi:predicted outer membrane protein
VRVSHLIACALGASAFAACSSNQGYGSAASAAGTVDLAAYPIPALGASEAQLLRSMSDADILGHFITVDSMEVATADSALRVIKTQDVLEFARLMKATHSENLMRDKQLAEQLGITPIKMFGGLRASHVAAALDSIRQASDLKLDYHYIMAQIELHQHVLAELEELRGVAKNPAVVQAIDGTIPMVRDHLARAHAIAVAHDFEKKRG